jgi:hypothetical protein
MTRAEQLHRIWSLPEPILVDWPDGMGAPCRYYVEVRLKPRWFGLLKQCIRFYGATPQEALDRRARWLGENPLQ